MSVYFARLEKINALPNSLSESTYNIPSPAAQPIFEHHIKKAGIEGFLLFYHAPSVLKKNGITCHLVL
jgi:hypothetical protein